MPINYVTAFLADRNQGKDVLIVKEHVFIGISLVYGELDELQALLINECAIIESDAVAFEPIVALYTSSGVARRIF